MNLTDFNFELPPELIGQTPTEPRDACKMLVLNKQSGEISHQVFRDLIDLLTPNDVLVLNNTKVFPARLFGNKSTGGKTEILLLNQKASNQFTAIGKGKLTVGTQINFGESLSAQAVSKDNQGVLLLEFNKSSQDLLLAIDELGKTPLPPYIHNDSEEQKLRQQYQTVYAKNRGSAAAPTAGLHFTPKLLEALNQKGIEIEYLTLHVGLGTFRPVTDQQVQSKTLHTEEYQMTKSTYERLIRAKAEGKRIIAVGTTTCRTLETIFSQTNPSLEGATNIFIQPGYHFKIVDSLITNFHLPSTSLLMLVTALVHYPNTKIEFQDFAHSSMAKAYQAAIQARYHFFSFGDAMFIS